MQPGTIWALGRRKNATLRVRYARAVLMLSTSIQPTWATTCLVGLPSHQVTIANQNSMAWLCFSPRYREDRQFLTTKATQARTRSDIGSASTTLSRVDVRQRTTTLTTLQRKGSQRLTARSVVTHAREASIRV